MSNNIKEKKYWSSLAELQQDPEFLKKQQNEFPNGDPFTEALSENLSGNRRDFFKMFGFTVGSAALLAACTKTPVKYALPYVNKPVEIMPSVANWYAGTFFDGQDYAAILVKTREGRPIKIEGNPLSGVTKGGVGARGHAVVLGLYDTYRLRKSKKGSSDIAWETADSEIKQQLKDIKGNKGEIRILAGTIISPSTLGVINDFIKEYPKTKLVQYDAVSSSGMLAANEAMFGKAALPSYHFENADVIVSFNADFLGTWVSPTQFTKQYTERRVARNGSFAGMSRHIQFETNMSLTGANADMRVPIKPSQEGAVILKLYNEIANATGGTAMGNGMDLAGNTVSAAAKELVAAQGKALVVSGSNDPNVQMLVNGINKMLGSYGTTIDMGATANVRKGNDADMAALVADMSGGKISALFVYGANPVYNYADNAAFTNALGQVKLKVSFAECVDETAAKCDYILPDHHTLESWGDAEPIRGSYSLHQPTINPLGETRQFQDTLLKWLEDKRDFYTYIKDYWKANIYTGKGKDASFEEFWKNALHDGVTPLWVATPNTAEISAEVQGATTEAQPDDKPAVKAAPAKAGAKVEVKGGNLADAAQKVEAMYTGNAGKVELSLYQKVGIGNGSMANIPWLQELPDPISKATWDNYVNVSQKQAEKLGIKTGDVVKVSAGKYSVELPAHVQAGQHPESISIAVGYGRTKVGKAAENVGKNAFPFATIGEGGVVLAHNANVTITKTGEKYRLAISQTHGTIVDKRPIVRETTLAGYTNYIKEYQDERKALLSHHLVNLYPDHEKTGHRWAMAIDLNACTGCGACVISCGAENNIAVVGKEEVKRGREMHWIRIDRYYTASEANPENPAENPEVVFMPMLCQHCSHAPCENVCPVLATVHSSEGLNQQAYNRCFGTRYCANNCPFKVRRFNWLDYTNSETFQYNPGTEGNLARLVLNPDVTVRARGVMEKCSFCVQRLQAGKLTAKKEGRALQDADVQTACSQSCPAGAIVFGDINDPNSAVAKIFNTERSYRVLEDLKVYPSIAYQIKVRNKPNDGKAEGKSEKVSKSEGEKSHS